MIISVWPGSHNSQGLTGLSAPLLQENIKHQHMLQKSGQKGDGEADISCVTNMLVCELWRWWWWWWSGIIFDLLAEIIGGIIMLGVLPLQLVTLPTLASRTTIVAEVIVDNLTFRDQRHSTFYNYWGIIYILRWRHWMEWVWSKLEVLVFLTNERVLNVFTFTLVLWLTRLWKGLPRIGRQ